MAHILVVEDDKDIIQYLTEYLSSEGFLVSTASGQKEALQQLEKTSYDLVLLDVSLKDGNGFAVCSAIKSKGDIPVIFVTASTDEFSVVAGLDMGADDYVSKPFRPRELLSRINRVLRRCSSADSIVTIGNLLIDTQKAIVTKNHKDCFLSALEYRLLLVFLQNRGRVLSRSQLLEEIWDIAGDYVNDNTLTVYIKRLREKVEDDPQQPSLIKTVRGLGYRMM